MRGRKRRLRQRTRRRRRGKGTFRSRNGYSNFPSKANTGIQRFVDDYTTEQQDDEAEESNSERVRWFPDHVTREGNITREGNLAFDFLNKKVQTKKLQNEMVLKTAQDEDKYLQVGEKIRYQHLSTQEGQQQQRPQTSETGSSPWMGFAKERFQSERGTEVISKREGKYAIVKNNKKVMRIIRSTSVWDPNEEDPDDFDIIDEVSDVIEVENTSDADLVDVSGYKDIADKSAYSYGHKGSASTSAVEILSHEALEIEKTEFSFEDVKQNEKVGGLMKHGPFNRILIVGDSRLKVLEKTWPKLSYIRPQFLIEPQLRLDGLKEYILSHTDLPKLANGTLLLCSVGLHDIISFIDYDRCENTKNHKCVKIMTLQVEAVEDLIKIVLVKVKKAYKILEESLDKSSVVCITSIIPCDPVEFLDRQLKDHDPEGHIILSAGLMDELHILKKNLKKVCDSVNKHLKKLIPMPFLWDVMSSYYQDQLVHSSVFCDGINIKDVAGERWSFRLNRSLQELFYGMEVRNRFIEFNCDQEIIIVGDSRFLQLQKMWCGDKPTFCCENELGFYNFRDYISKNFVGLKNKVVIVCLGLNDLIKFSDDDECFGKDHEPNKVIESICERYSSVKEYLKKILNNVESCFKAFCEDNSSLLLFATVYPFLLDTHMTTNIEAHKETAGHNIMPKVVNPKVNKNLNDLIHLLNNHLKYVSKKLGLPVWDMHHVVCRGHKPSELSKSILADGVNPSKRTSEELIHSYFRFVNEKLHQNCAEDVTGYQFAPRPLMEIDEDSQRVPSPGSKRSSSIEFRNQRLSNPSDGKGKSCDSSSSIFEERPLNEKHPQSEGRFSVRRSQSPKRIHNFRYSRSPERGHKSSFQESSYVHSQYGSSVSQRFSERLDTVDVFKESIRLIKDQCQREKDGVVSEALLDLCDTHTRECERYLCKPDAHPDYTKEYRQFVEKKKTIILKLGGNPETYDYLEEWLKFWPTRLLELFNQSWSEKKYHCISAISSKKRSSSYFSRSSSSPHRKECSKVDVVHQTENLFEPRVSLSQFSHTTQDIDKNHVKFVEVLTILAYMKDTLGVLGVPVNTLYEQAMILEKKSSDTSLLLKDTKNVELLNMVNEKLVTTLVEREAPIIQKTIMLEAQALLSELLKDISQKKKSSSDMKVDICQIARLTLGKSVTETMKTLESFLVHVGFSDLSREIVESIYAAVKEEQLKLNHSYNQDSLKSELFYSRAQPHQNLLSTEDELSEEFFIGQKSFSRPGPQSPRPSTSGASTSGYDPSMELEEEFCQKRFMKSNISDTVSHNRANNVSMSNYISHKHIIPPPAPVISDMLFSRKPRSTSSASQGPNVDFDMIRKGLEALKKIPQ